MQKEARKKHAHQETRTTLGPTKAWCVAQGRADPKPLLAKTDRQQLAHCFSPQRALPPRFLGQTHPDFQAPHFRLCLPKSSAP